MIALSEKEMSEKLSFDSIMIEISKFIHSNFNVTQTTSQSHNPESTRVKQLSHSKAKRSTNLCWETGITNHDDPFSLQGLSLVSLADYPEGLSCLPFCSYIPVDKPDVKATDKGAKYWLVSYIYIKIYISVGRSSRRHHLASAWIKTQKLFVRTKSSKLHIKLTNAMAMVSHFQKNHGSLDWIVATFYCK